MNDFALFFGKFLRHGTKIASIAPSSRWLSRAAAGGVDWSTARTVIELGAGTGPITQVLAERAPEGCRVIAIERDPTFAALLRERYSGRPGLEIVEADVRDLESLLAERGIGRADAIVSGLPVPSFPKDLQRSLFRVVGRVLAPGGVYSQITEIPWVYMPLYRRHFDEVRFVFEPRNLPPAGAYLCRGVKPLD